MLFLQLLGQHGFLLFILPCGILNRLFYFMQLSLEFAVTHSPLGDLALQLICPVRAAMGCEALSWAQGLKARADFYAPVLGSLHLVLNLARMPNKMSHCC